MSFSINVFERARPARIVFDPDGLTFLPSDIPPRQFLKVNNDGSLGFQNPFERTAREKVTEKVRLARDLTLDHPRISFAAAEIASVASGLILGLMVYRVSHQA
jgi:hypothetical protein